jgi:hypothetical protein
MTDKGIFADANTLDLDLANEDPEHLGYRRIVEQALLPFIIQGNL